MKEDYENSTIIQYKKLHLELGNKYIYSFYNTITIIPYADIVKVYASNMIDGRMTPYTFITIETKDNMKYHVAAKPNNKKISQFEEAINLIKDKLITE